MVKCTKCTKGLSKKEGKSLAYSSIAQSQWLCIIRKQWIAVEFAKNKDNYEAIFGAFEPFSPTGCFTVRLLRGLKNRAPGVPKLSYQTIFDPQNPMVTLLKSQDEAVPSSFWPHLRGSKEPPEGNMVEQNPFKFHINMHKG